MTTRSAVTQRWEARQILRVPERLDVVRYRSQATGYDGWAEAMAWVQANSADDCILAPVEHERERVGARGR